MDLIESFSVDHTNLFPGIYKSRLDVLNGEKIRTYDIRMTAPNREPAVTPAALHSIEHLVATYLRNDAVWKERLIYWGPMGCLTGNYMIVKGDYDCEVIRDVMIKAMTFVVEYQGEVPGTLPANCGNCLMHDLPMAKFYAKRYVEQLKNDFHYEYQQTQRVTDTDGTKVFDS